METVIDMIPTSSIIAMIACIVMVVVVPIAIAIFLIRKYTMNLSAIILGFLMYIVFDTILMSLFDSFIVGELSTVIYNLVNSSVFSYAAYYAFIHALFYTAGFSVAVRMVLNQDTGVGTGIAIGMGCGGASAILGTAQPMVNSFIAALQINKVGEEAFLAEAEEAGRQAMIEAVAALRNSSAADFLFAGYEKIMLFLIFVATGIITHLAITHRSHIAYLYAAMVMLIIVYVPPALYTLGVITSVLLLEILMTVLAFAAVAFAIVQVKKYGQNPLRY